MRTTWLVALLLTCLSAKGQNSPVTNTRTSAGYAAIQAAIDAAHEGDTLVLAPVRFTERISLDSTLYLMGSTGGGTVLDIRNQPGYGVHIRKGSAWISDVTIQSSSSHFGYAIHSEPGVSGITLNRIRVVGNATTGIDLNGLESQFQNTIESCEVLQCGAGFGLALSSCQNVVVHNFNSRGNGNGDIGILESAYTEQSSGSLQFSGNLNLRGVNGDGLGGIVIQSDSTVVTPGVGPAFDIDMQGTYVHKLTAVTQFDGAPLGYLLCNTENAPALTQALSLFTDIAELVSRNVTTGALEVWPGMMLQDAIAKAVDGESIRIMLPGDYDATAVTVDRPLTILGPNDGVHPTASERSEEARITGGMNIASSQVTVDGIALQSVSHPGDGLTTGPDLDNVTIKNTVIRGNADVTGDVGQTGARCKGETRFERCLWRNWPVGIILEQGSTTVSNSTLTNNQEGIRLESNGAGVCRLNAHGLVMANAGADAFAIASALAADSLMVSLTTGTLHRHAFRFDTPVNHSITGNSFFKSEVQVTGLPNGEKIELCENNDFSEPVLRIQGCMNPAADNYEACATIDPGLCLFAGCVDPNACNFDADANLDDAGCDYTSCADCLNPLACNYNPEATVPGYCDFTGCRGCTEPSALNFNQAASVEDGSCWIAGCINPEADNYNSQATVDNGACLTFGCTDPAACNFDADANYDNGTCESLSCAGCTDMRACNYDEGVVLDDGSCNFLDCRGCTNASAINHDPAATVDDGSCRFLDCAHPEADAEACQDLGPEGCTDVAACNFNAFATIENESCEYQSCLGCTDVAACNFNPDATIQDGACDYLTCAGCTDAEACNFDASASVDWGCLYPVDAHGSTAVNCDGDCLSDLDNDGTCDPLEITGCTQVTACNYDLQATEEDGSCEFSSCAGCTDPSACNFDPAASNLAPGSCDYIGCVGCMDPEACNFIATASVNQVCLYPAAEHLNCDGSCIEDGDGDGTCDSFETSGCTSPDACNFNPSATEDDGSCEFVSCAGCTNPAACNFDSSASLNDGSCDYGACIGCTDTEACNFLPGADVDDGSCTYPLDVWNDPDVDCEGTCLTDADGDGTCDGKEFRGCMDTAACNFNPLAEFDNGSCDYSTCAGCTAPDACNYNNEALIDDGTCSTPMSLYGSDAFDCFGFCAEDVDSDGVCDAFEVPGCQDPTACNFNPEATDEDGSCEAPPSGFDCDGVCTLDTDGDGVCDPFEIEGCTDGAACNFDTDATEENGTCTYPEEAHLDCDGNCLQDSDNDGICDGDEFCLGDLNKDGLRSTADILILLTDYGCVEGCGDADLDNDGQVTTTDILAMLTVFGTFCD